MTTASSFIEVERLIVGAGYAATMHASLLIKAGAAGFTAASTLPPPTGVDAQDAGKAAAFLADQKLMVGMPEDWHRFEPKAMGQSPANLSPDVFDDLPLWFAKNWHGAPLACQASENLERCFLRSDLFGWAIALQQVRLKLFTMRGIVVSIAEDVAKDRFVVTVDPHPVAATNGSGAVVPVVFHATHVDVASGTGPARELSTAQVSPDDRRDLRETGPGKPAYRRLITGAEGLMADTVLPPKKAAQKKKMFIFGGAPTGAWFYERLTELGQLEPLSQASGADNYELLWLARPGVDPMDDAWGMIRIGQRNIRLLEHSETVRREGDVIKIEPDGNGAMVTFTEAGTERTFKADQACVAIGRDAKGVGGPRAILSDTVRTGLALVQHRVAGAPDEPTDPPVALRYAPALGDRSLEVLGAAMDFLLRTQPPDDPLNEAFYTAMNALLGEYPDEVSIPPGVTVVGHLLMRRHLPDSYRTTDKVNINTWTLKELSALPVGANTTQNESGRSAAFRLLRDNAAAIVETRAQAKTYRIFADEDVAAGEDVPEDNWTPGFRSIVDIEAALPNDTPPDAITNLREFIRV